MERNSISNAEASRKQTREEILLERKIRRYEKKVANRLLKTEEKRLQILDGNKSKKISIIDRTTKEKFTEEANKNESKCFLTINHGDCNEKSTNTKDRNFIDIDLNAIITNKKIKTERIVEIPTNKFDLTKIPMNKGKKYENKTKPLTKLKKQILQSRYEAKLLHISPIINECPNKAEINEDIPEINKNMKNLTIEDVSPLTENIPKEIIIWDSESRKMFTELKRLLRELIQSLFNFQDRAYKNNPIRANMRRRYVVGFHEVLKSIKLKRVLLIVIATDIEKKGCEDIVNEVKITTSELEIPLIFALRRKDIGYLTHKKVGVSCIAILSKDGAEELFNKCLECHNKFTHYKVEKNSTL